MHLFELKPLEHAFSIEMKVEIKNMDTGRVAIGNYRSHNSPSLNLTQLTRLIDAGFDQFVDQILRFALKYNLPCNI